MSDAVILFDQMLELLAQRCRVHFKTYREPASAVFARGGMQASARVVKNGLIQVAYESEPHKRVLEECGIEQAAALLSEVLSRKRLYRVTMP
ncbi:MAG: hypothetical protein QM775_30040 [Pirellulales bacterium]